MARVEILRAAMLIVAAAAVAGCSLAPPLVLRILRRNRKSTAKRLGIAIRLPASCLKFRNGESVRTMITAPQRWPSDTIFTGMPLSARHLAHQLDSLMERLAGG